MKRLTNNGKLVDNGETFRFMLWLKDKGLPRIRDLTESQVKEFFEEFRRDNNGKEDEQANSQ